MRQPTAVERRGPVALQRGPVGSGNEGRLREQRGLGLPQQGRLIEPHGKHPAQRCDQQDQIDGEQQGRQPRAAEQAPEPT